MRLVLLCMVGAVSLSACAQTPQEAAAYRQFGMQMLAAQAQADAQAEAEQQRALLQMQMNAPRYTDCHSYGSNVSCTTW